jgi:hypothetical protein
MMPDREERSREERIRLRALEIWREQGCPEGRAREHWQQAEREVGGDDTGGTGGNQPVSQAETPTGPDEQA